jgi:hypothetical protein
LELTDPKPLGAPVVAALVEDYLAACRREDATSDRLFLSRRRSRAGAYEPITESGVQQLIRDLGEQASVRKRVRVVDLAEHQGSRAQHGQSPLASWRRSELPASADDLSNGLNRDACSEHDAEVDRLSPRDKPGREDQPQPGLPEASP